MAKRRWAMLTEGIVRVLVFDGDDDYRSTLSAHLMSAGMEVMAYGHGGTTLDEALHSGPCDAALLNVHQIGRAHGCTPVTHAPLVCRLRHETTTIVTNEK